MGFAYAGLDKFEEAIEAYEKAIEIKPDDGRAYYTTIRKHLCSLDVLC
jgi:tetratricopeptide (TPR) repeat protein